MAEKFYRGRVVKVVTPNLIEIDLELGLGVRVIRRIVIGTYKSGDTNASLHCLVILVGGKVVYVKVDDETIDGHVRGTVMTTETRFAGPPECPVSQTPYGEACDVVDWMAWSAANGHNPRLMRSAMKG